MKPDRLQTRLICARRDEKAARLQLQRNQDNPKAKVTLALALVRQREILRTKEQRRHVSPA
jgi:hypothetical protein